nr:unnamed protein product [Callosobruchus chinensis]
MDSDEEALLLAIPLRRRRRQRNRKRLWMHPLTAERVSSGQCHTLMSKLRADSAKFFNYMRMSQETFDELFRYLATGCLFKDLHYTFQCGTSTAQEIVFDVCEKILQHLSDICIQS